MGHSFSPFSGKLIIMLGSAFAAGVPMESETKIWIPYQVLGHLSRDRLILGVNHRVLGSN
jgi:hypothetical protein